MALTPVERIRWIVADAEGGKFYPMLTDEQIEDALDLFSNNTLQAAAFCAGAIIRELSQKSTKEVYGDIEVWAEDRKLYLESLKALQSNPAIALPASFMPYLAGISQSDLDASADDLDNPRRKSFLYTNTTECEQYGFNFTTPV
jgi:hypothetical protein